MDPKMLYNCFSVTTLMCSKTDHTDRFYSHQERSLFDKNRLVQESFHNI